MTYPQPQVAESDQPRLIIALVAIGAAIFFGLIAALAAGTPIGDAAFKIFMGFFGFGNAAILWYFDIRRLYYR
jgi:hypothetical protein